MVACKMLGKPFQNLPPGRQTLSTMLNSAASGIRHDIRGWTPTTDDLDEDAIADTDLEEDHFENSRKHRRLHFAGANESPAMIPALAAPARNSRNAATEKWIAAKKRTQTMPPL